jgi:hypothetical protein
VRWFPRFEVTVLAVAGPYVLIDSEWENHGKSSWLIDIHTGAATSLESSAPWHRTTGSSPTTTEGTWRWASSYTGDANNEPTGSSCGTEQFTITNH